VCGKRQKEEEEEEEEEEREAFMRTLEKARRKKKNGKKIAPDPLHLNRSTRPAKPKPRWIGLTFSG
jgi:hypothetical protein